MCADTERDTLRWVFRMKNKSVCAYDDEDEDAFGYIRVHLVSARTCFNFNLYVIVQRRTYSVHQWFIITNTHRDFHWRIICYWNAPSYIVIYIDLVGCKWECRMMNDCNMQYDAFICSYYFVVWICVRYCHGIVRHDYGCTVKKPYHWQWLYVRLAVNEKLRK